jgi:hypothetical protein
VFDRQNLFARQSLPQALTQAVQEVRNAARRLPEEKLTSDEAALADLHAVRHDEITLDVDSGETTYKEVEVDQGGQPMRMVQYRLALRFTGPAWALQYRPSTQATVLPVGRVLDRENEIVIEGVFPPSIGAERIKNWRRESVELLQKYVAWANEDLARHRTEVARVAKEELEARKRVLAQIKSVGDQVSGRGI